ESFEDQATADYMNRHFVPVKVDREERPDIDAIYMEAVQSITGQGGWPLTVFLDPEGVPFHGGTYFPPDDNRGMPSFMTVMEAVVKAFDERRDEIRSQSSEVRKRLGAVSLISAREGDLDPDLLDDRTATLDELVDSENGGFGSAPKFPPASILDFLLARGRTDPAELTLDRMAAGGIFDQIGGGFSRYSVDSAWQVPHFEKMLYDNALLARTYLHAWQETGHERHRRVAERTLDWAMTEMNDAAGGFYASLDADSGGGEGLFYTWTADELESALGDRTDLAMATYGATASGNFEGRNVLRLPAGSPPDVVDPEVEAIRAELLRVRSERVRPDLDDKVLCSWNALMISALAEAGAALNRSDYVGAARECADFIWSEMRDSQGSLLRTWRHGDARLNAYLEDHALLLEALLDLYQATFSEAVFRRAQGLAESMIERFADRDRGGFFSTSHDHENLIARRKDVGDHPIPSGSSSAARGLLRLGNLTGESMYTRQAEGVLKLLAPATARQPDAFGHLLQALDLYFSPSRELAIVTAGPEVDPAAMAPFMNVIHSGYRPRLVIAAGPDGTVTPPLMLDRRAIDGKATAYLCEGFSCRAPLTDPHRLKEELDADHD
ncbi:MAG: thioredoxin domain-containing protein, partial [Acidobacteriota bacterium]